MKKILSTTLVVLQMLVLIPNSVAADTGSGGGGPTPVETSTATPVATATSAAVAGNVEASLTSIRVFIKNKDFRAALAALKVADTKFPNNADVNNLLGYSSRKLMLFKQANAYYAKALRINPRHLGALEYQGELFVETKKISNAKKNLAKLKSLCGVTCEEYLDLKQFIVNK